jgi:hypothetical protein
MLVQKRTNASCPKSRIISCQCADSGTYRSILTRVGHVRHEKIQTGGVERALRALFVRTKFVADQGKYQSDSVEYRMYCYRFHP